MDEEIYFKTAQESQVYAKNNPGKTVVRNTDLNEENKDREIIMKRIYNLSFNNDKTASKDEIMSEIKISFFKMNLDESPESTFYRDKNNEWEKK